LETQKRPTHQEKRDFSGGGGGGGGRISWRDSGWMDRDAYSSSLFLWP
jgi:hypothetical protein